MKAKKTQPLPDVDTNAVVIERMVADRAVGADGFLADYTKDARERVAKQLKGNHLHEFIAFSQFLERDVTVAAKAFLHHELVLWIERTSHLHFVEYGEGGVVPLWCLAGDWELPPINHGLVADNIERLRDRDTADRYRAAHEAFLKKHATAI